MLQVSVIIPTYNRAGYLSQALASVLAQSRGPFEIIVVDDGSTDNTADVIAAVKPTVRYVRHERNLGVSAARNTGLHAARGEIIAWLDADDLWEPEFLSTTVPLLAADSGLDGVHSGYVHIDAAGNPLPQASIRVAQPLDLFSSLIEGNFIATPSIVVRKKCYELVGDFDTQLGMCEDYDMWLRLARDSTILGLPTPLVRVRVHDSNTVKDTVAFCRFRLALVQKHFGAPEGDPSRWVGEKQRAYALALLEVAVRHSQDGNPAEKWQSLERATIIWPDLLHRLDMFYELACGEQARGRRGHATSLDIEGNGAEMLGWLDDLFAKYGSALESQRHSAYGNAYLGLAMLSDQAHRWREARRYMLHAVRANPRLLGSPLVVRRLLKLHGGQRLANLGRSRHQEDQGPVPDIL